MTKEVIIRLRDDFDKELGEDVTTREFSFDGVNYEIELGNDNYEHFRLDIKKWIDAAREVRRKKKANAKAKKPTEPPPTAVEIRDWARANGYEVAVRGQLSSEVRDAYLAAHPRKQGRN